MSSLNKVCLIGNLGKDPEIKRLQSGGVVANFSIATSESWRDKQTGERKQKTEWHRVVVWSEGLVKVIEQYVKKGSKLYIEGKLQTRKWQDQSGQDRYATEVVLNGFDAKLVMLNSANDNNSRQSDADDANTDYGSESDFQSPPRRAVAAGGRNADMDDDIPF